MAIALGTAVALLAFPTAADAMPLNEAAGPGPYSTGLDSILDIVDDCDRCSDACSASCDVPVWSCGYRATCEDGACQCECFTLLNCPTELSR